MRETKEPIDPYALALGPLAMLWLLVAAPKSDKQIQSPAPTSKAIPTTTVAAPPPRHNTLD